MKALITGITGMAGSFLAEHLIAHGDQVIGTSRRGLWPSYLPETLARQASVFAWDVAADLPETARERIADFAPDCIFHLAALSVPADCGWPEPTPLALATNVGGVERVCSLAASLASRPRVVLASSCHVYGDVEQDAPPCKETDPLRPSGGYGKTKRAAEEVLRRYTREGRLQGVVARAFHHTGPRQLPRLMVPQWARQLISTPAESLRIVTRDAWLDLADVRDVVRAYRLLALQAEAGAVYNVATGRAVRSGDVLDLLLRMCGSQREVLETAPGVRGNPVGDMEKIRRQTGWSPEIPLQQTLRDTLDFWRARPFD
ncbi:MAG: GDP-mannose 4,6-dehydratase [Pirellulaceae bacterium]